MQGNRPADVLLLLAALLLVASAAPAASATGAVDGYSGRVVIGYATAGTRTRRLEDEVAPELSSSGWAASLSGGGDGHISYDALNKNKPVCPREGSCAGKGGGSYTRPCTYKERCRP